MLLNFNGRRLPARRLHQALDPALSEKEPLLRVLQRIKVHPHLRYLEAARREVD